VTTERGDKVYVHVLDWTHRTLALPRLSRAVRSARLLRDGSTVTFTVNDYGLLLKLPDRPAGLVDEVVVLTLAE
jgi:alpha-L-fucosidase